MTPNRQHCYEPADTDEKYPMTGSSNSFLPFSWCTFIAAIYLHILTHDFEIIRHILIFKKPERKKLA